MPLVRSDCFFKLPSLLFMSLLFSVIPSTAQEASATERSPQALALIQRVLNASGGAASVGAIQDLIATGTLSNPPNSKETEESSITVSVKGLDQLRMDSSRSTGIQAIFYQHGMLLRKEKDGSIVPIGMKDEISSISHFVPLEHLAAALHDTSYYVSEPETVEDENNGQNLYHFRLQRMYSTAFGSVRRTIPSIALDYYVDATTNCIVSVQNRHSDRGITPKNRGPLDIYQFSGYSVDHGILLPHQITISLDKRLISTINIAGYQLNTGLEDTYFAPVRQ